MFSSSSNPSPEPLIEPVVSSPRYIRRAFLAGVFLAAIALAFLAGYQKGSTGSVFVSHQPLSPDTVNFTNTKSADATIDFSLFWRVWNLLKEKYVDRDTLDARELFYGAIDGMLAASGDPYTTFFSPKENKEFQEDISGSFEGIGAEMAIKDNILTIVTPLDDSPASRAGLLPNDRILKINGETTVNFRLEEAVSKIRGPRGTEVTLTIFREGEEESRDITVRREVIVVKSVKLDQKDGFFILRISRFGDDTVSEVGQAVAMIGRQKARGLVIDLRNNPGGFLDAAIEIAHHFLPDRTVVVLEENAAGDRKQLVSKGQPTLGNLPTVILINEGSASASEILAGALREHRSDIVLVGKKTFGKGSVQELIPTGKDTAVKITVARWLTPKGNQINEKGIQPDVEVSLSKDDFDNARDPQLDRALEILEQMVKERVSHVSQE